MMESNNFLYSGGASPFDVWGTELHNWLDNNISWDATKPLKFERALGKLHRLANIGTAVADTLLGHSEQNQSKEMNVSDSNRY